jgi:hypothetical protein
MTARRAACLLPLAGMLLCPLPAAAASDPVSVFSAACLDELPDFSGTPGRLAERGLESDGGVAADVPLYGDPREISAQLRETPLGAQVTAETCLVFWSPALPDVTAPRGLDRIAAEIERRRGVEVERDCARDAAPVRCHWAWTEGDGAVCTRVQVSVEAAALTAPLAATAIHDCREMTR